MKALARQFLVRLTQIDYDRDMAMEAIQKKNGIETMLGIARFVCNPEGTKAEFSAVVRDDMQKKGIGHRLLNVCLSAAADRNIECILGHSLSRQHSHAQSWKKNWIYGNKNQRDRPVRIENKCILPPSRSGREKRRNMKRSMPSKKVVCEHARLALFSGRDFRQQ